MPKTFYTERDIEDLFRQGVTALEVDDDVVLTDLARERARRLGIELRQPHDKPPAAPERPYIAKIPSPSASESAKPAPPPPATQAELHARVRQAVLARVGNTVDPKLLDAIIDRVLQNIKTRQV